MFQQLCQNPSVQINDKQEDQEDIKYAITVKREKFQVEIRKGKRDEILNRKRMERINEVKKSLDEQLKGNYQIQNQQQQIIPLVKHMQGQELDLNLIQRMENMLNNLNYLNISKTQKQELEQVILNPNNPEELLVAFKSYDYLLQNDKISVNEINLELSQKLLQMLAQLQQYPAIIYEVVDLLSIISSGNTEQTDSILNIGGVTIIDNVFNYYDDSMQIQEKLVDVIGNLIVDSSINRDLILKQGIIDKILSSQHKDISYMRNAIWLITIICCIQEYSKFCDISCFYSTFLNTIKQYPNDKNLVRDSLVSLSILGSNQFIFYSYIIHSFLLIKGQAKRIDEIEYFCSEQMAECLIQTLNSPSLDIREMALKIIMILTQKKDKQCVVNFILDNKLDQYLFIELDLKHKVNKKAQNQQQNQVQMQTYNEGKIEFSNISTRKKALISIINLIYEDNSFQTYLLENYNLFQIVVKTIMKESSVNVNHFYFLIFQMKNYIIYLQNILNGLSIIECFLRNKKSSIIDSLLDAQFFEALYIILDNTQLEILKKSLELVFNLLSELEYQSNSNNMHEDVNPFNRFTLDNAINMIHNTGVIKQITEFQGNRSKDLSEVSMNILDSFFPLPEVN